MARRRPGGPPAGPADGGLDLRGRCRRRRSTLGPAGRTRNRRLDVAGPSSSAAARSLASCSRSPSGSPASTSPASRPTSTTGPTASPGAVRRRIHRARAEGFERIFVAYADCGTGGLLEPVLKDEGVERLPGAHCYEVFAGTRGVRRDGRRRARHVLADRLPRPQLRAARDPRPGHRPPPGAPGDLLRALHPGRLPSQTDDPDLLVLARRAADRLGLAFEHRPTGIGNLAAPILAWSQQATRPH